jgi:hypothetical protein
MWLRYHLDTLPAATGWQRGLRDVLVELHHHVTCCARRLRGNPPWDLQGTLMDDTQSLEDMGHRLQRTFDQINPHDLPARFSTLVECLHGAIRQQIRLGREIDLMQLRGQIRVDVMVDTKSETAVEIL